MDFLEIRKKAKERARARAAEEASEPTADAGEAAAPDEPVGAGALGPDLPAATVPGDARFTTWRPGAGARPALRDGLPEPVALGPSEAELGDARPAASQRDARLRPPDEAPAATPGDPLDEFFYRPDEDGPSLPELAPVSGALEGRPAPRAREEYLTFLLGADEYAVAIARVREVIRTPPITEVPRAPADVLGVVTVRGEVVAVLDPRGRLGLPPAAAREGEGKVVIVDVGEGPCGLLVDRVAGVVRLLPGSVEPCPEGMAGSRPELLAGVGRAGDRLFTVLELGAVLRRAPARPDVPALPRRSDASA